MARVFALNYLSFLSLTKYDQRTHIETTYNISLYLVESQRHWFTNSLAIVAYSYNCNHRTTKTDEKLQ
jgi:hypothetical protein